MYAACRVRLRPRADGRSTIAGPRHGLDRRGQGGRGERVGQRGSGVKSPPGVFMERFEDHAVNRRRERGHEHTWGRWLLRDVLHGHGQGVSGGKGQAPGQHLVEHDTAAVDIRFGRGRLALRLLGREVGDGAQDDTGGGLPRAGQGARNAEVTHFHLIGGREQYILWLNVTVDHAVAVGEVEGVAELTGNDDGPGEREPALAGDDLLEGAALDVLHDDVIRVIVAAQIVDGHDAGVRQTGGELGLLLEAAHQRGLATVLLMQDLDRHDAV